MILSFQNSIRFYTGDDQVIKKIKSFSDNHHLLCKFLVFFFSASLMMALSYIWTGSLVYYNGDSKMYISIADNFLDNGHFIQTHRVDRENFIVPFGFPAILTVIRFFTRSDVVIALAQYVLFGLSGVLLYCSERNFFGNIGGLSVLMHCLMLWRIHYAAPGCIITETWYITPIIFCIWLLSRKDIKTESRLTMAYVALFIGFVIRPVLGLLFFPLAAYMVYSTVRRKYNLIHLVVLISSSALIMTAIGFLNYRETGHFVFTEAYSGISVYLMNNDNIANWGIDFAKGEYDYADDQFLSIYNRTDIDYYDKNEILGELGYKYIFSHPLVTIKHVVIKFVYLFFTYWKGLILFAAAGAVIAFRRTEKYRKEFLVIFVGAAALAVVTSFGLYEARYTYAVFPFYTLFSCALVGFMLHNVLPVWVSKAKNLISAKISKKQ